MLNKHIKRYHRLQSDAKGKVKDPEKLVILDRVMKDLKEKLFKGEGFVLSDIRDYANSQISLSEKSFNNRELKVLLTKMYGERLKFSVPEEVNKSVMIFLEDCPVEEMADRIRTHNPLKECASILRDELQK